MDTLVEEKRRLNSRVLISRLPTELLGHIFSNLQADLHQTPGRCVGSELLNPITHVCHSWRVIALGTPTLWTRIVSVPGNDKWTQEMVMRSKRSALTAIIYGQLDRRSEVAQAGRSDLINNLNRCRTIRMEKVVNDDLDEFWASKVDALQLVHLYIDVQGTPSSTDFILSDSHLHAPKLRVLFLLSCGLDWQSQFLPHLAQLTLSYLPEQSILGCRELIKILITMPCLAYLDLGRKVFQIENRGDGDIPPTNHYWQEMRVLVLRESVMVMSHFLNKIKLLPETKLRLLSLDSVSEAEPHFRSLYSWLSTHFEQCSTSGTASESDSQDCIRTLVIRAEFIEFSVSAFAGIVRPGAESSGQALFRLNLWDDFEGTSSVLLRLPLSRIAVLYISIRSFEISSECWVHVFGSIPTLETIHLGSSDFRPFFDALRPGVIEAIPLPFKSLKSISLDLFSTKNVIAEVLRQRLEHGLQLQEFALYDNESIPTFSLVSELMELVPSILIIRRYTSCT